MSRVGGSRPAAPGWGQHCACTLPWVFNRGGWLCHLIWSSSTTRPAPLGIACITAPPTG